MTEQVTEQVIRNELFVAAPNTQHTLLVGGSVPNELWRFVLAIRGDASESEAPDSNTPRRMTRKRAQGVGARKPWCQGLTEACPGGIANM